MNVLGIANPFVRVILRSPFHRMSSGALLLVTYTGRRSGRTFTIPVMYAQHGDDLLVYVGRSSEKVWWRSLRPPANVIVRLQGRDLRGTGSAIAGTSELRAAYLERFPRAAKSLQADIAPIFVRITDVDPV